ncbi:hypothetical protein GF312_09700 [Candidatus Poribacteria bacterium]|nr:hypothetical protein [Candidatus Poribacteria bacterium]
MRSFFATTTVVFLILCVTNFTHAQIEGLILYLSFDEGAGDTVIDISGNENNGSIEGAEWTQGQDGSALEFNGSDAFVEVPYNEMFNLTEAMTLAAWVKPAQAPFAGEQWRGIINGQKTNHGPYLLQMSAANGEIGAWLDGAWEWQVTSAVLDTENFWHLVGTYDVDEGFKNYVNGELDSENAVGGNIQENVDEGIVIGHNYSFDNRWFEGVIDEVSIFNRALTEDEVMDLFEGTIKEQYAAVSSDGKLASTWASIKSH